MAQMSNYLENALINGVLRNTQYTVPSTVYLALYTTDPTDADTGTECTLGSYSREAITFSAPSNGGTSNSADIVFQTVTSGTATITHIGIRDALTGGNLLFHAPLSTPRTLTVASAMVVPVNQLTVTLA